MAEVGDTYKHTFIITSEQVRDFASISGDNNPIHLDAAYAANTVFKKPIIHGIFSASTFSKFFGTEFPGEGTIYISQTMQFLRPMYPDTEYEAQVVINNIDKIRNIGKFDCKIVDKATNKATLTGEAMLMHKEIFK
ncbi:MAG: MaoC family dehydratase [Cytophagales bacterium]|nr:MaoC family dehydratase [Cytophagales bacterium]